MDNLLSLLGGVGMFLLGMEVMTAALRDAAGRRLRALLARFTTTPLRGVLTGAGATALIQSSSATTVMVVGFVGAGLMTMPQALGVVFGANLGTTATGWLVSVLGFKLQLDVIALAALFPASLGAVLGRGAVARTARVAAGLCLLLVALSVMQAGAAGLTDRLTPAHLPGPSLGGLLALAGLGLVVTVLMQSSSAALALALVMLDSGSLALIQALAIVLGMNIGTTFTALLASVGGSAAMRQTGLANLVFNIGTFALAFPLVWFGAGWIEGMGAARDPMTVLLLFHTGFNLLGVALFVPVTPRFAALIARVLPDPGGGPMVALDPRMLRDAEAALVAAQTAADAIAARLWAALGAALAPSPDYRGLAALSPCDTALDDLRRFMQDIRLPEGRQPTEEVYSNLLHQMDHLGRMRARASESGRIQALLDDPILRRPSLSVGASLRRLAAGPSDREARRLVRLHALVSRRQARHRRALLLGEHAGLYSLAYVFDHTDAMRWLNRMLHNAARVASYQQQARAGLPAPPEGNAG
ncbi:Na/Pi symporter [Lutimaribacter sp. EGI FJ00015]|uniref:Na/Pi symporter n=1 Tax=Lutimaribacter degradans TaxID=2945989 RepID=A0ACC5ZTC7_9RHOB|nr:Na/Pi symporter [Lutimaribacter sp. EGI FJ00013]MCM2561577.1 Na/Pi symporter [Lutimaribacter sp. EGI FJ00013]MCO0612712.1 Na/Pi symporter [Lutimaribacter sp. EGI FJ00015]MCO0635370.1 Na/Pi symporter [Lutimaribacter sp. EGI FJ00014]